MATYENDPNSLKEAGIDYAIEQIGDLLASGVDGIHLYAMNRPEVAPKGFAAINGFKGSQAHERQAK